MMNVLPPGDRAPGFRAETLAGETLELHTLLASAPATLCFAMPLVHASRLVVGYLRRLKEHVPALHILIVLQGDATSVTRYATGYLEGLRVVHDRDLSLSKRYGVTHVPSTYYLVERDGQATIAASFTGFSRPAMNNLAAAAAEATGKGARELITALDNKGEYELAEKALSA